MFNMKKFLIKLFIVIIGLIITGIGVGIFLYSNLGVDPASVFQTGLSKTFNISYGNASALSNIVILGIVLFIDKKYVSVASIVAIFAIGYSADITYKILNTLIINDFNLISKIVLLVIGNFIMALGVAIYIHADLGVGAIDLVSEIVSVKTKFEYKYVRMFIDLSFFVVGIVLGGSAGIGTVFSIILTGPFVSLCRPYVSKVLKEKTT